MCQCQMSFTTNLVGERDTMWYTALALHDALVLQEHLRSILVADVTDEPINQGRMSSDACNLYSSTLFGSDTYRFLDSLPSASRPVYSKSTPMSPSSDEVISASLRLPKDDKILKAWG